MKLFAATRPRVGASADALADFYDGDRMRILIAAVFYAWLSSIPCGSRGRSWAGFMLTVFPRAMLIMAAAFKHGFHKEY
jgi:hypothetical protein